ncbi:MAG TPA: hypothetical protein VNP94_13285 [Actinomycetota bacterium]|nr:hypothetical protein [Actinomycetota bacterium]
MEPQHPPSAPGPTERWWSGPVREEGLRFGGLRIAARAAAVARPRLSRLRDGLAALAGEAWRQVRTHPALRLGAFVVGAGLTGGLVAWLALVLLWTGVRALLG